jgi:hypothetical protein
MAKKIALKAKLYLQIGGSYDTPTWVEAKLVGDLQQAGSWNEVVVQTRETPVEEVARTTLPLSWTGRIKVDSANAAYQALRDCYHDSGTSVDVMILDGPRDENGVEGVRAHVEVMDWSQDQGTANYLWRDFVLKPSIDATDDEKPKSVEVTGGNPTFTDIV